jgi:hypothetical protein
VQGEHCCRVYPNSQVCIRGSNPDKGRNLNLMDKVQGWESGGDVGRVGCGMMGIVGANSFLVQVVIVPNQN